MLTQTDLIIVLSIYFQTMSMISASARLRISTVLTQGAHHTAGLARQRRFDVLQTVRLLWSFTFVEKRLCATDPEFKSF